MDGFHTQLGLFFVALRAFSFGWMCGFWAGFKILTFLQDFESKDDKMCL